MLIGIIADTHDQKQRTRVAVQLLQSAGAQALFHCGDLIEPDMVEICAAITPGYFVFGNNDEGRVDDIRSAITHSRNSFCLELAGELELAGKRIAITHGHCDKQVRRLLNQEPDYLFTGHSHVAADWMEGVTRRINPGALHRASSFSVAILNLANDHLQFLPVGR